MRVQLLSCVMAVATPLLGAMAAHASDDVRIHVEFEAGMPAQVQTWAYGGRGTVESSAQSYAYQVKRGESVGTLAGYIVKPAPMGCDKPGVPCPARRDTLTDDRADDLPANFSIEISGEPEAWQVRHALRSETVYSDGLGPWVAPYAGRSPFPSYDGSKSRVLATDAAHLRKGALAQADCFDVLRLCMVRITYSWDLRVSFMSPANDEALAKQVRAVDAVMQAVIRPGPLPGQGVQPPPREVSAQSYIAGLPQDRVRAVMGQSR